MEIENLVDLVILWQGENSAVETSLISANRRRNNQEVEFLLQSLENLTDYPNVYLVLDETPPEWLDLSKLKIVSHEDILPASIVRPCQNSTLLQCYVHSIPGLSENFLLFDDDLSILK